MNDFRFYSPEDIICSNLQDVYARMNMLCEQELAHLQELAAEITKDLEDDDELAYSLADLLPQELHAPIRALPQNEALLEGAYPLRKTQQAVWLCMEICRRLAAKKSFRIASFFDDAEEEAATAPSRVVYQRNSYADSAYLLFASFLGDSRAIYSHSFPTACEDVYNGVCQYCILPLENSSEGQLSSFVRLIDRYGLKIAATCDVATTDGSRVTRFALLRRSVLPILSNTDREFFFEFSASMNTEPGIAAVLIAAELCKLTLCRMDSRPRQATEEESGVTRFVFRIGHGNLAAFLLYLSAYVPTAEYIGIYPHLSQEKSSK